ncbi:aquaporin [bacterium]|nr:aquaporin [bacterium]
MKMTSDLKKCFVEFFGTFFLCFTILCCVLLNTGAGAILNPLIIGLVLAAVVYAGGPISGAHYNPAVSLGIFLIGRMGSKKTLLYIIFQIFGAAYAALMILFLSFAIDKTVTNLSIAPLMIAEIIFTTLLIYVVMFCAVSKRVNGNNYFGFAIGTSLTVGIAAVGSICLTAFNPAVAVALGLAGVACLKLVLLTILANVIAAFIACGLFKLLNLDDIEKVEIVGIDEFIRK